MGGRAHGLAMGRPVALHALPLLLGGGVEGIACAGARSRSGRTAFAQRRAHRLARPFRSLCRPQRGRAVGPVCRPCRKGARASGPCASAPLFGRREDRKSTRLNSSHVKISYAVFCLKKKKKNLSM